MQGENIVLDPRSLITGASAPLLGVALRAWSGTNWVETAVSRLDENALGDAVDALELRLAAGHPGSPPPGPSSSTVAAFDAPPPRSMREWGTEGALDWVRGVFGWATGMPSIKFAQVVLRWSEEERYYLNTAGANCFQRLDRVTAGIVAVAVENGRSEFNNFNVGRLGGREILEPINEATVRETAEGARALLAAKAPPTGPMNVLLDPGTTATFAHESFGHGAEADQFVRERSYLQPLVGQQLGPDSLTLVDDGSIPGGWGSMHFDDEGHPSQRTFLVDRGRFVGALHDRTTAFVLGAVPTGNARRADFLSQEFVRMTNTSVLPGEWSLEELVREAKDGIVLERWLSGIEDPLGGRMQIKVHQGHRIENGKVTELVSSMALSGSVLQFLKDIRAVGKAEKDPEIMPGFCRKGHGDMLPVGDAGTYLLSRAYVGPA